MAEFLRTSGINHKLDEIIINAKEHLLILSPYVQVSDNILNRLLETVPNKIKINFVYGKKEKQVGMKKLERLTNLNLFFNENLHAKLYCNESEMIITSLNLYEYSQTNNREMGIYFTKENSPKLFNDALNEAKSIIKSSNSISKAQKVVEMKIIPYSIKEVLESLTTKLSSLFPSQEFKIYKDKIIGENFQNSNISILIEPNNEYFRIAFRLVNKDWRINDKHYKQLRYESKDLIESSFPIESVNWGGQMKRVKIDLNNRVHKEFFHSTNSSVQQTIDIIKTAIKLLKY